MTSLNSRLRNLLNCLFLNVWLSNPGPLTSIFIVCKIRFQQKCFTLLSSSFCIFPLLFSYNIWTEGHLYTCFCSGWLIYCKHHMIYLYYSWSALGNMLWRRMFHPYLETLTWFFFIQIANSWSKKIQLQWIFYTHKCV